MWLFVKQKALALWAHFKKPIVFVGGALLALLLVILDAIRLGKRIEKRKELLEHEKSELEKVDRMSPDELHDDILRRSK